MMRLESGGFLMISWLLGPLGLALRYPLITGLLLLSGALVTWNFFENRSIAREAVREAQRESITRDTEENKRIQRAAEEDEQQHHETVEKLRKATEQDIEKISRIRPHQCLDVRLNDIGLQ